MTDFEDMTPNLSEAEKVWRCRCCGVERDASGPVAMDDGPPSAPPPGAHIVYSDAALNWMGAALYAVQHGNSKQGLPRWDELPPRLRNEYQENGRSWLEAIIPLLEVRHD
jgi:hypothetical protein